MAELSAERRSIIVIAHLWTLAVLSIIALCIMEREFIVYQLFPSLLMLFLAVLIVTFDTIARGLIKSVCWTLEMLVQLYEFVKKTYIRTKEEASESNASNPED